MKTNAILLFLFLTVASPVFAEDWTLTDGTIYHSVKVLSHDAAFVTILDSDGGGKVPLKLLPAALQAKFGYDAAKAAACEASTAQAEKNERSAIIAEERQQAQAKQAADVAASTAQPIGSQPVTLAPVTSARTSGADDQMKAAQRQDIQEQIDRLQDDIKVMREQLSRTTRTSSGGDRVTTPGGTSRILSHGAYEDKIQEEMQKIQALQEQLAKL